MVKSQIAMLRKDYKVEEASIEDDVLDAIIKHIMQSCAADKVQGELMNINTDWSVHDSMNDALDNCYSDKPINGEWLKDHTQTICMQDGRVAFKAF